MNSSSGSQLRNGSEKKGAANRNHSSELDAFTREWHRLFTREGEGWEGDVAVRELKNKGVHKFLFGRKRTWQFEDLFQRVWSEIKLYRNEASARRIKEYFDDADEFLEKQAESIKKKAGMIPIPELKTVLRGF